VLVFLCAAAAVARAQSAQVVGLVRDDSGAALPGVSVELRSGSGRSQVAMTDAAGSFHCERVASGRYQATFTLINFATARREVVGFSWRALARAAIGEGAL